MRDFSPLQYRELKVERFSAFSLKMLYRNEGVFVSELSSVKNPDDVRLVSFVDVSELLPSETESSERLRLLMIESLFNEAANAFRKLQAGYKKRLQWNRIILHNRTLLGIRFKSLQEYGLRMMKQAGDIGLEKLTVLPDVRDGVRILQGLLNLNLSLLQAMRLLSGQEGPLIPL